MKIKLLLTLLLIPAIAFLQPSKDTSAPYFKSHSYPNIKILLTDSVTVYTKADIPINKTVAFIFFSPDCEHCQLTAKELVKKIDSLQNILMIWCGPSYLPVADTKAFYEKYQLNQFPNIIMGKEMDYYMPIFYRIEITPYVAIYKNGIFYTELRNGFTAKDLIYISTYNYIIPTYPTEPSHEKKKNKKGKNK